MKKACYKAGLLYFTMKRKYYFYKSFKVFLDVLKVVLLLAWIKSCI